MSARGGIEKRRHPRVRAKQVSAQLRQSDRLTPCLLEDVSTGGVFLQTADVLPVGMPVSVCLGKPGQSGFWVTGRVVWALAPFTAKRKGMTPGMRIRFDPTAPLLTEQLEGLIADLSGVPSDERSTQLNLPKVAAAGEASSDSAQENSPKLWVQVQGLLMQMGDLQSQVQLRESEVDRLNKQLETLRSELKRSEQERKAAEMALARLSRK